MAFATEMKQLAEDCKRMIIDGDGQDELDYCDTLAKRYNLYEPEVDPLENNELTDMFPAWLIIFVRGMMDELNVESEFEFYDGDVPSDDFDSESV